MPIVDIDESLKLAKKLANPENFLEKKIAILPGYSTQFLSKLLRVSLYEKKIFTEVLELEYGVYERALLSKDARLSSFAPDLAYFCVGTENIVYATPEEEAERWGQLWNEAHRFLQCTVVMNTFEEPMERVYGNFEAKYSKSKTAFIKELNSRLVEKAPSWVHFHDVNFLASYHGRKNWRDEKVYDLYKLPCSYGQLGAYSDSLAGVCGSIFGKTHKALVLDLDNTLWGGVIGDDGVAGIQIGEGSGTGEAFKRFQTYLKQLKDRGILLTVCSKNEDKNAREPFLRREEMVLKLEDFSCFIANWETKPENIKKIAKTLNIGLESLVFVDDNPAERTLVRQALPQVTVLELPEDPALYVRTLNEASFFETLSVTAEDSARTAQYQQEAQRREALSEVEDYSEYLKSLKMKAEVRPFDELHLPRISQLINKTNQFNLTTKRYTEADVEAFTDDENTITRYIKLSDQFGDHGLISVLIAQVRGKALEIDTWLMSCRVFQREVESLMLKEVIQAAKAKGLTSVTGSYIPTAKNDVVKNLYKDFGFNLVKTEPNGVSHWSLALEPELLVLWNTKPCPIALAP